MNRIVIMVEEKGRHALACLVASEAGISILGHYLSHLTLLHLF